MLLHQSISSIAGAAAVLLLKKKKVKLNEKRSEKKRGMWVDRFLQENQYSEYHIKIEH